MNRKLALAGSLSVAVALVSGAVMVGALLSASPEEHQSPDLTAAGVDTGSSTVTSLDPVVVYQDEYEYVVTGGGATPVAAASDASGSEEVAGPAAVPQAAPAPAAASAVTSPPATAAPAPATTTTTRPEGVPRDWPADKPIPPMPAGCRDGQLEDNGVWNCQH